MRFLTCTYCGARLEIHRSGGAAYTQVLQDIDKRTQRIEEDVSQIKSNDRLEQLDREWLLERERFMVSGQRGGPLIPTPTGSILGAVIATVFGIVWIVIVLSSGAPPLFALFGVFVVGMVIYNSYSAVNKASGYNDANRNYQRRRQELVDEMKESR